MSMYDACARCGQKEQGRCWTCDPHQGKALCGLHLLECAEVVHETVIVFAEGVTPPTQGGFTPRPPSLRGRVMRFLHDHVLFPSPIFTFVRTSQTVYVVFEDVGYNGSFMVSIWATETLADIEAARLESDRPGQYYNVEEHEVQS